jgi:hypothetical protein
MWAQCNANPALFQVSRLFSRFQIIFPQKLAGKFSVATENFATRTGNILSGYGINLSRNLPRQPQENPVNIDY